MLPIVRFFLFLGLIAFSALNCSANIYKCYQKLDSIVVDTFMFPFVYDGLIHDAQIINEKKTKGIESKCFIELMNSGEYITYQLTDSSYDKLYFFDAKKATFDQSKFFIITWCDTLTENIALFRNEIIVFDSSGELQYYKTLPEFYYDFKLKKRISATGFVLSTSRVIVFSSDSFSNFRTKLQYIFGIPDNSLYSFSDGFQKVSSSGYSADVELGNRMIKKINFDRNFFYNSYALAPVEIFDRKNNWALSSIGNLKVNKDNVQSCIIDKYAVVKSVKDSIDLVFYYNVLQLSNNRFFYEVLAREERSGQVFNSFVVSTFYKDAIGKEMLSSGMIEEEDNVLKVHNNRGLLAQYRLRLEVPTNPINQSGDKKWK